MVSVTKKPRVSDPADLKRFVAMWSRKWKLPGMEDTLQIEFSTRLRKSLGRALPEKRIVRLNPLLRLTRNRDLLPEVLCHEVAHVAARDLHGSGCRPHGPEWRALVQAAGYAPPLRVRILHAAESRRRKTGRNVIYEHRCPVCRAAIFAEQRATHWRCACCVAMGLDGKLEITSRPKTKGQGKNGE
jgi:SprT protein